MITTGSLEPGQIYDTDWGGVNATRTCRNHECHAP